MSSEKYIYRQNDNNDDTNNDREPQAKNASHNNGFDSTAFVRTKNGILIPRSLIEAESENPVRERQVCAFCKKYGTIRKLRNQNDSTLRATRCEVMQHNGENNCWIVAKDKIFDVSSFKDHPGGQRAFHRRAGGIVDSLEDFMFHSKKGQKQWSEYFVGYLVDCRLQESVEEEESYCTIA